MSEREATQIPQWKLERYLLGELPPEEMASISRLRVVDASLQEQLDNLEKANFEFLHRYPVSSLLTKLEPEAESTTSFWLSPRLGLAVVAAVVLTVGLGVFFRSDFYGGQTLSQGRLEEMGMELESLARDRATSDKLNRVVDRSVVLSPDVSKSARPRKDSLNVSSKPTTESLVGNGFTPEGPAGTEPNMPPGYKDKEYQKVMSYTRASTSPRPQSKTRGIGGQLAVDGRFGENSRRHFDRAALKAGKRAGRLLAYNVQLSYESTDIEASRLKLLALIGKYGFLQDVRIYEHGHLNAQLRIKAEKLYEALVDFAALGKLKHEVITAADLTPQMFAENVHNQRDAKRIARKRRALRGAPSRKNWTERQNDLEESEDREDESRIAKWNMRDRVKWAQVSLQIQPPARPAEVEIPNFGDVLANLASFSLSLIYYLLYAVPLLAIGLVVWLRWFRR